MKPIITFCFVVLYGFAFAQAVNRVDANGKKQGPWQKTYEKSRAFEYKGQFKDDKPVGTFTYFYPSTKKKAVVVHNEKTGRSEAVYYHENGVVSAQGIYRNQLKDSVWTYWGPSGKMSTKETYKNDKLNGVTTIYYVPEEAADKRIFVAKTLNYKDGILHGEATEFFEGGTVKSKVNYVDGKKEGAYVVNHPTGKPMLLERYKGGVQHGWSIAYDESGKEIGKKYYCNGQLLEGKRLENHLKLCKEKGINPNG